MENKASGAQSYLAKKMCHKGLASRGYRELNSGVGRSSIVVAKDEPTPAVRSGCLKVTFMDLSQQRPYEFMVV